MKLTAGKRILMFFHWLLSLLLVAAFAVYLIVPEFLTGYYDKLVEKIGFNNVKVIGIALLAIYLILAVAQVILIFKRRKRSERGFIVVDSSDNGKVRIAISAIEQMVRQSIGNIDGLSDMKTGIDNQDDAIGIRVAASIENGRHVPTITMNMQRAIRQFVETNCGVAVRSVSISINAVTNQADAPRRRHFGRGQGTAVSEPVNAAPATYSVPDDEPETETQPEAEPYVAPEPFEPAPVVEPAPAFEPQPEAEPAPAFDLDAPYVSEFAKDLAEMKAREAAQAASADEGAGEGGFLDGDGE